MLKKEGGGGRAPLPLPLRPSISHLVNFLDGLARKCLLRRYPGPVDFSWNFSPLESPPPPLPRPPLSLTGRIISRKTYGTRVATQAAFIIT